MSNPSHGLTKAGRIEDYCKGCGFCVAECPCGGIKMVAREI